ncbi:MAG TPA: FtsW/RodA/SpoVE family cell cycle protein [Anaerolineae bacterium]|nr:FtsW/RodA/SpoVE family cell cycle protein [Anaerolineae bacterium]
MQIATETSIHRERKLLLIAAAFFLVGTVTLAANDSPDSSQFDVFRLAFAFLSFAVCFGSAHVLLSRFLPHHDPLLLPVGALLTGLGLLLIARLAINFLLRQATWLLISTGALLAVVRLSRDLRWLRRFRYTWLFGGLALLAATLVLGVNPSGYGPRLWLGAWGVYFQPSEPLKLLMVVYLASYLAERRDLLISEGWKVGRWRFPPLAYVGPLLAMFGLAMVLLAWQQDLGAAMLFFFTFLAMLYLATGQWGYVAAGLVLFFVVGLAGYRLSDRIALRVDGWLNPWPEAADRAFQIVQSLLAFGAGGVFGQGLGLGSPTYIPAVHTDFVFAAIGEEFGLAGTLVVVALYGVSMFRGFRIAARAARPFERFLAAGLAAGWVIQAWVIMAGNAKLAPIAGVTLPLVSYGGSSLLTSFIALGLLLHISGPTPKVRGPTSEKSPMDQQPILYLAGALLLALALLVAVCGYWAVVRADELGARDDNPRRVLYEQRIVRGRILDRDGAVLADVEMADDGTVTRRYRVPGAAPAVGYASLRHGTGGIEAAFDDELRGEADRGGWQAAWEELLHRPPQGRDARLTLDAGLQIEAQRALEGHAGAVVLLDATSGEILALGSSPTFDPEALDEEWEVLREDPAAPLVNRATQGLYQPGAALQTVVIAETLSKGLVDLSTPTTNSTATIVVNGTQVGCSTPLSRATTLGAAYAAGCPAPFAGLGEQLGAGNLEAAVERWGLTTPPSLEIPTVAADWDPAVVSTEAALRAEATGQGGLTVSPLHMALVAATLADEGEMVAPRLVLRVQDTEGDWETQPGAGERRTVLARDDARALLAAWDRYGENVAGHWGVAVAGEERPPHAWFIGVAPASGDTRYAISVLIEHAESAETAVEIGTALLEAAVSR